MWVYIVECSDGTFYTGVTKNLEKRIFQHNHSGGAKYTSKRKPVKLIFSEKHLSHAATYKREKEIKNLTHAQKSDLVSSQKTSRVVYFGTGKAVNTHL